MQEELSRRVYVSYSAIELKDSAFDFARRLRREGLRAELEQAGRSLKGQLRQADRIGAGAVVIFGDDIEVKDMDTGEQRPAASPEEAFELVKETLR